MPEMSQAELNEEGLHHLPLPMVAEKEDLEVEAVQDPDLVLAPALDPDPALVLAPDRGLGRDRNQNRGRNLGPDLDRDQNQDQDHRPQIEVALPLDPGLQVRLEAGIHAAVADLARVPQGREDHHQDQGLEVQDRDRRLRPVLIKCS